MQPFIRTVRTAAWTTLALWLLFPGLLWAQGTSPWVEAVNELTGPVHGSDRAGAISDRDRGGRADVCVRRGR